MPLPWQAAALEKLLLVTSTVPKATNPPPRPALSALGPVNDNPPSPYLTAGQAGQQQLPNGQGPAEGGGGGAPGPGRDSPVFRMLMGAASANAAAAAAACGEDGGAAAATTAGGEGEGGVEAMSAEDAAEVGALPCRAQGASAVGGVRWLAGVCQTLFGTAYSLVPPLPCSAW